MIARICRRACAENILLKCTVCKFFYKGRVSGRCGSCCEAAAKLSARSPVASYQPSHPVFWTVQEAWLRLSRSDTSEVENLGGWLTTVVARVCRDMLRSRQSRREEPLEGHVSEAIVKTKDRHDLEQEVIMAEPTVPPCQRAPRQRSAVRGLSRRKRVPTRREHDSHSRLS
jgi:hypothetical protein